MYEHDSMAEAKCSTKLHSRVKVLAVSLGLVLGTAGLSLSPGCLALDDDCMTDGEVLVCVPDDCDPNDVLCPDTLAGREVVDNWLAVSGDVTICPFSGTTFEVAPESPRVSYEGHSFVFECASPCIESVESNPGFFLDDLVEGAGGPASDPNPSEGGAIDP